MNNPETELKELEQSLKEANKAIEDYIRMVKIHKVYFDLHTSDHGNGSK